MDERGRVLIAQRLPGKHLAGFWEFPGGKLESGEPRAAGLARELREELGIEIRDPRPLKRVRHTYPHGEVLIDMWVVSRFVGKPTGMDGQALKWCGRDELNSVALLPADRPIVRALRLPERLTELSTPDYAVGEAGDGRLRGSYCANAEAAAQRLGEGAEFLLVRGALPNNEIAALCSRVPIPVFVHGITLEAAWALGASGIHEIVP